MAIYAKEGKSYDPIKAGMHGAICFRIIDLGTVRNERWDTVQRRILLSFEIPGERIELQRDGEIIDAPRTISKEYNLSLHKKAFLRQHLESWQNRELTAKELKNFDVTTVLGKSCTLQIIHKEIEDHAYANIQNILPLMGDKLSKPESVIESFSFDETKCLTKEMAERLPEWILKKVMAAPEYSVEEKEVSEGGKSWPSHDEFAEMSSSDQSNVLEKLMGETSFDRKALKNSVLPDWSKENRIKFFKKLLGDLPKPEELPF